MRKISILSAVTLFVLAVSGCSKEAAENTAPRGAQVSFIGDYADAPQTDRESRTAVDLATGKTAWNAGDVCGVWVTGNTVQNAPFTNSAEALNLFTGTLDQGLVTSDPVWAYYPYSADAAADLTSGRTLTVTLPLQQVQKGAEAGACSVLTAAGTLTKDAGGNPAIGKMRFIHQTAGLCFNVYGSLRIASTNPETLVSVSIETESAIKPELVITDPAALCALSGTGANAMTVTVENAPEPIGYAKADGTKAYLTIPHEAISVTKITVTTDQAVYTKTFAAPKTVAAAAGKIYPINLNLNTFSIAKKFKLGVPGAHNSWNAGEGITGRTADFFSGMVDFNGEYKFNKDGAWFGYGSEPKTLYYTLSSTGGNLNITGNYYVIADTFGSANATLVNTITLPGMWNEWNVADPTNTFTYDTDRDLWTLSGVTMNADDEFKIAFNNDWQITRSISAGEGSIQPNVPVKLIPDNTAGNMFMGQTGTYTLTLDLSTYGGTLLIEPETL